jgi:ketosteroid isomerase-like protein
MTPREVLDRLLQSALDNDPAQADLYAEDGFHELPFSPTGQPLRLDREQIRAAMRASTGSPRIEHQELRDLTVHQTADPEVLFAEFELAGTLAGSGKPVELRNAMLVRVRDGKILLSRNYLNPMVLAEVMAGGS